MPTKSPGASTANPPMRAAVLLALPLRPPMMSMTMVAMMSGASKRNINVTTMSQGDEVDEEPAVNVEISTLREQIVVRVLNPIAR